MSIFRNGPPESEEERIERGPEAAPLPLPVTFTTPVDGYPVYNLEKPPSQVWRRARRVGWELAQTLVLAAVIFFTVRAMAQNFRVEGSSMEPGLHDGQYLLVNKAVYFKIDLNRLAKYLPFVEAGEEPQRFVFRSPKRGDVVVFRFPRDPERDFIKRVIGVPGDTVEVQRNGDVLVNGVKLAEPYVTHQGGQEFARQQVPPGEYFVLGDNRTNSFDSRGWGFVPEDFIIGQAMVTYWPLSEFGGAGNKTVDLGFIRLPLPAW